MAERACAYIDGESHFLRTEEAWQDIHGDTATLERLRYIGDATDKLILVNPQAKVFWTRRMNPGVMRAVYFTAASCDTSTMFSIKTSLRSFELEPAVFHEVKQLADQRKNLLKANGLIEKPKQVDIALAVRMIEDARSDVFDKFHLYTSDVDFLPVIKAVMARAKQVYVYGHKNGLAKESPLLHEPDLFIDLGAMLRGECELLP
jgi:uncharacterized LabA/DUF88 family protein